MKHVLVMSLCVMLGMPLYGADKQPRAEQQQQKSEQEQQTTSVGQLIVAVGVVAGVVYGYKNRTAFQTWVGRKLIRMALSPKKSNDE